VCYPAQQAKRAETTAPLAATQIDLGSSGLTMIETDPSKAVRVVAVAPESREHAPRRRQRQREIYSIDDEPLQQVETHTSK
jgi:hypothetical protein